MNEWMHQKTQRMGYSVYGKMQQSGTSVAQNIFLLLNTTIVSFPSVKFRQSRLSIHNMFCFIAFSVLPWCFDVDHPSRPKCLVESGLQINNLCCSCQVFFWRDSSVGHWSVPLSRSQTAVFSMLHLTCGTKLPPTLCVPYQCGTLSSLSSVHLCHRHALVVGISRGVFHCRLKILLFSVFPSIVICHFPQSHLQGHDHLMYGSHSWW